METDLKMTLLEDIATSARNVLRDALPNARMKVEVLRYPKPHIKIEFPDDFDMTYPGIVKAKATLFPTATRKGID